MGNRYDVIYTSSSEVTIEPHFCREYDCFGTNPDHGFTFEEAKKVVSDHYLQLHKYWNNLEEEEFIESSYP